MKIREMTEADAKAVLAIYAEGIATGHATFESDAPDWQSFDARRLKSPRLVAVDEEQNLLGWAAASAVSDRCVYGGVAESTIYVAKTARGQGFGRKLLTAFVKAAEDTGFWTLNAGIFAENIASIQLHEACGFRIVGTRKALGKMSYGPKAGQWRDIVLMEHRSQRIGLD